MIRHVAMFTFRDGTTPDQVDTVDAALETLPGLIEEIRAYTFGRDLALAEGTWDYVVVADFDTIETYMAYSGHPDHRAVIDDVIRPIIASVQRVQFEVS